VPPLHSLSAPSKSLDPLKCGNACGEIGLDWAKSMLGN